MGLEPEMEWTLKSYNTFMDPERGFNLRWDIYVTRVRDGVDPQKVQHKYGSRDGSGDGVDNSQKLTSLCYSYGDKNFIW